MKIFISWSGRRGGAVASALRNFIPLIFQRAEVYTTTDDIDKGARWSTDVRNALQASNIALVCVTPESINSPWLTFEAGALSMGLGLGRVIPLLAGLSAVDVSGPLAQFQTCRADRSGVRGLLRVINEDSDLRLPDSMLNRLFDAMWPRFETELQEILVEPERSEARSLEDQIALSQEDSRQALTRAEEAAEEADKSYKLGEALVAVSMRDFRWAEEILLELLRRYPLDRLVNFHLSDVYMRQNREMEAIELMSQYIDKLKEAHRECDGGFVIAIYNRACYQVVKAIQEPRDDNLLRKGLMDLEQAIRLEPINRDYAWSDEDFKALKDERHSEFYRLVGKELP